MTETISELEAEIRIKDFEEKAQNVITKCMVRMKLKNDPRVAFFLFLLYKLKWIVNWHIPTAGVNGKELHYNPEWLCSLEAGRDINDSEVITVFVHEIMHLTGLHHTRMAMRDPRAWNVACDLAINSQIKQAGFKFPADRLMPGEGPFAQFPHDQSAEWYYANLPQGVSDGKGPDPGGMGQVMPPKTSGESGDGQGDQSGQGGGAPGQVSSIAEEEAEWKSAVQAAAEHAKSKGNLPADIARHVEQATKGKVDWRTELRQFCIHYAKDDYSWSRPNRRFISRRLYLPSLHSLTCGHIIVAIDTSGSIGGELLKKFVGEMESIAAEYKPKMTVLVCDAAIHSVTEIQPGDPIQVPLKGGGGTSHKPVFDWIEKNADDAVCVVCLTDLFTDFPSEAPALPCLWCVYDNANPTAPFGRIIPVED